jgi:hypothetical protein
MKLDRGEWVRTEEQLLALAEEACPGDWSIRRYLLSYHATEGAILTLSVPSNQLDPNWMTAPPATMMAIPAQVAVGTDSPKTNFPTTTLTSAKTAT